MQADAALIGHPLGPKALSSSVGSRHDAVLCLDLDASRTSRSRRPPTDSTRSCSLAPWKTHSSFACAAATTGTDPARSDPVTVMSIIGHTERSRHSTGLQIDEEPAFQQRMWRLERIGWWGIAVILLGAAAGLFGHGPVSRATLELTDRTTPAHPMTLDYERFGRAHSESQFSFSRPAAPPQAETLSLWLSDDYLTDVEVLRITPDPVFQELESNGVRYNFRFEKGPQHIVFRFKATRGGGLSGAFRLNGGPPATFRQWLSP